ncbi:hypothetical protein ACFQYP_22470 [Nonomuraea antimicrobica]
MTGEKRELLPASLADRDWVASMSMSDTHLACGLNSQAELLMLEKAAPHGHRLVKATAPGEKYIVSVLIHDGHVYFAGRPSGTFYRYDLASGELEVLGVPYFEAATHRLLAHEGRIYGVQDSAVFVHDPATGSLDYLNLVQRGFKTAPEEPMSVHSDGRRVYVGGKGGADVHDLATGEVTRLGIAGEPKTLLTVGGTTYLGVYTQAALYAHRAGSAEADLVARTGNQQDRPRDLAHDDRTGLIVMPTQPEPGHMNGALSSTHPEPASTRRTGRWWSARPSTRSPPGAASPTSAPTPRRASACRRSRRPPAWPRSTWSGGGCSGRWSRCPASARSPRCPSAGPSSTAWRTRVRCSSSISGAGRSPGRSRSGRRAGSCSSPAGSRTARTATGSTRST